MKLLTIAVDNQGESYFTETPWPFRVRDFAPPSPPGYRVTDALPAREVCVCRTPAGYQDAWHPVPGRVLVTLLSGRVRVETSDGDQRIIEAGQLFLHEDDHGRGHRITEVDGREYQMSLVFLRDDEPA